MAAAPALHLLYSAMTRARPSDIAGLVRHWWIVAIRGGFAMLFGASILLWPDRTLPTVVLLFGLYALVDGVWAMATARGASRNLAVTWPVGLEGLVSVALGLLALVWPFVSRELIYAIAGWGILTGVLEIAFALRLPSRRAAHWLLGTGGGCSLSLALLVLGLPHADAASVATALGAYALLFGVVMLSAASAFRQHRIAFSVARAALLLGLIGALAGSATAGALVMSPTAQIKQAVDQAIQVLQDPTLKPESKRPERHRFLRAIADEIFDFEEMSRRAMGPHWRALTEAQRREFVGLFSDILERAYMSRIEQYSGERILYTGERVDDDFATVFTRIVRKETIEIPVDYRLLSRNGRWMAYDVSIEGAGLAANYRTQFDNVIRASSYDALVKKLRSRVEELQALK